MSGVDREILELKERVAKLETQVAYLLRNLGLEHPEPPPRPASSEVLELVRLGRHVDAIRLFRQETGAGLKDAKTFIESLET